MFNIGTKVVVVASSINSEKTGPRVGSSGFVHGNSLKCAFHNDDLCPKYNRSLSTLFFPQKIIFTNFGFEEKLRIEEKLVVCVLPIPLHNGKGFTPYLTYRLTDIMQNGLHNKRWQNAVEAEYGWCHKPICIVIPDTYPKHIGNGDIILFRAWLKAMLKSRQISNCLFNLSLNLLKEKVNYEINHKIVNTLVGMTASQCKFDNVKDEFLEQYRKDIIYTIVLLNTINNSQQKAIIQTKQISDMLIQSRFKTRFKKKAIEILSNIMFSPIFDKLYNNKKGITTKNKITTEDEVAKKKIVALMEDMLIVKDKLINLYPTLIRK
jgi:hypothetical protein